MREEIVARIIEEQALIIGPVAWEEASKVNGLSIDSLGHKVSIQGDPKQVLEQLIAQYERLFGRASVEVCREAVRAIITQLPEEQVPAVLR